MVIRNPNPLYHSTAHDSSRTSAHSVDFFEGKRIKERPHLGTAAVKCVDMIDRAVLHLHFGFCGQAEKFPPLMFDNGEQFFQLEIFALFVRERRLEIVMRC